jgi:hypothetical protein
LIGQLDRAAQHPLLAQRDALRGDRFGSFRYLILRRRLTNKVSSGLDNLTLYGTLQRTTGTCN